MSLKISVLQYRCWVPGHGGMESRYVACTLKFVDNYDRCDGISPKVLEYSSGIRDSRVRILPPEIASNLGQFDCGRRLAAYQGHPAGNLGNSSPLYPADPSGVYWGTAVHNIDP